MALLFLCTFGAAAAAPFPMHNGDLVFQESQSTQSSAILAATGSKFTHMGIIAVKDPLSMPTVIEASGRVREIEFGQWIKLGKGARHAEYRLPGLSDADGLRIVQAARKYLGRSYDTYFRFAEDRIYCSELPLLAFRSVGIELGHVETLAALNANAPQVQTLFQKRWREHPDCRAAKAKTADACWQIVLRQEILTPASIAADKRLTRLFSDF